MCQASTVLNCWDVDRVYSYDGWGVKPPFLEKRVYSSWCVDKWMSAFTQHQRSSFETATSRNWRRLFKWSSCQEISIHTQFHLHYFLIFWDFSLHFLCTVMFSAYKPAAGNFRILSGFSVEMSSVVWTFTFLAVPLDVFNSCGSTENLLDARGSLLSLRNDL